MKTGSSIRIVVVALVVSLGATAAEREAEDATTDWVVQPVRAEDGTSQEPIDLVVRTAIAARFPELEFAGTRRFGALAFRLRAGGKAAVTSDIADRLGRVPGVLAATPLPSPREMALKRARTLAKGDITSMAAGVIVRYRSEAKRLDAQAARALPATELARLSRIAETNFVEARAMSGESYVLDFPAARGLDAAELAASRLEMDPEVEFATVNGFAETLLTPNDTAWAQQWNFSSATVGINAQRAWDITTGSAQVRIAIIDTGVLPHPEFTGRLLPGYDFVSNAAWSNDGNGRDANATDSGGWRPAGLCSPTSEARNSSWHGTHVAGTAAATGNNGSHVAGVNWVSPILPVRVLGACGGTDADIFDGMRWAAGLAVPGVPNNPNPARVINMSLGGPGNCIVDRPAYFQAVLETLLAGSTIVVAAGNDSESALVNVPASCHGTIKVAAIGPTGNKASYSNYSRAIEIAAPGGELSTGTQNGILSTVGTGLQSDPGNATTRNLQGTSMAAPHVAGVASLVLSVRPTLSVAQVRDIIRATRKPFPAGSNCIASQDCGLGIVDAHAAVTLAQQAAAQINFSDLYFNPTEDGWGVNFMHTGDTLFGTWFTYGANGDATWFVMPGLQRIAQDFFRGDIFATTGTSLFDVNGQAATRSVTRVGEATIAFFGVGFDLNPNLGYDSVIFAYTINGVTSSKAIGRQVFRSLTICSPTTASRASATNYQDLWWNSAESGWGINLAHQGDTIFATWFTYDAQNSALWLVGPGITRTANPSVYAGKLYVTSGVPYTQINGSRASTNALEVGQLTLTFTNGENARMDYTVNGITKSKNITRQPITSPSTVCRSSS